MRCAALIGRFAIAGPIVPGVPRLSWTAARRGMPPLANFAWPARAGGVVPFVPPGPLATLSPRVPRAAGPCSGADQLARVVGDSAAGFAQRCLPAIRPLPRPVALPASVPIPAAALLGTTSHRTRPRPPGRPDVLVAARPAALARRARAAALRDVDEVFVIVSSQVPQAKKDNDHDQRDY